MIGLDVAIVLVLFVALGVLGARVGADSRPSVDDPPDVWFGTAHD